MAMSGRPGFLGMALFFLALAVYAGLFPERVNASFKRVPEKNRPAWSSMPSWYIRLLGVFFAMGAGFAVYMFLARG